MKRSHTLRMYEITIKGYEARERGEPCVPPYKGNQGFNRTRNKHWRDGWLCADREIKHNQTTQ